MADEVIIIKEDPEPEPIIIQDAVQDSASRIEDLCIAFGQLIEKHSQLSDRLAIVEVFCSEHSHEGFTTTEHEHDGYARAEHEHAVVESVTQIEEEEPDRAPEKQHPYFRNISDF